MGGGGGTGGGSASGTTSNLAKATSTTAPLMSLGNTGGTDMSNVDSTLNGFNNFMDQQQAQEQELISGSDYVKNAMATAARQGANERRPAMAALGGGTMAPNGPVMKPMGLSLAPTPTTGRPISTGGK